MTAALPLILMVEDSPTQALLLQNVLERNGFAVSLARNGEKALASLSENPPFLVITDIQMPGMDGYELCRRVKADPATCHLPVMLLTSLSSPADIIQGLECGADNFVVKPYEESFLISRIESIRDQQRELEDGSPNAGIPIAFEGKEYVITSSRRQILNLLLSTYEAAVHTNRELLRAHEQIKTAQAQLIEAEKLQSIGRLASGVAHEIRNPLSIIEMAVSLLSDHAAQDDLPVFDEVREAVRRANLVIDSLIDLALPRDTGMSVVEIGQVIEEALLPFASSFSAAGINVRRDYQAASCKVRVDLGKIEQVFANVFANARDAMPRGGELSLTTRVRPIRTGDSVDAGDRSGQRLREGDSVVAVCFADTGAGLAPENLRRVFDPFFSTKPTGKGVGLGLTVARKIVELHGGRIAIENRVPRGAEVTVLLKCAEASAP